MKAAAETFWVNQDAQTKHRASTLTIGKWFNKSKQTLRHLFLGLYQQQTLDVTDASIKDEFFYGSHHVGRKNILNRTWRRHSAFFVYSQQVNSLQRDLTSKTAHPVESVGDGLSVVEAPKSFQVKSVKPAQAA